MAFAIPRRFGLALTFLLAIVLLAAGAAPRLPAPVDPGLARFIAAGGSLADLCKHGDADLSLHCDSCRLVTPAVLPDPPLPASAPIRFAGPAFRMRAIEAPKRSPRLPGLGERAPPGTLI